MFSTHVNVAPLSLFDPDNTIGRGEWMRYRFPDLPTQGRNDDLEYEVGRRFSVLARDPACAIPGACVWVGFDPAARHYYLLPLDAAEPVVAQ